MGTLINDTPANICVDLALAGSEGTSPVDFLTITTRADLTVPVLGWEFLAWGNIYLGSFMGKSLSGGLSVGIFILLFGEDR